MLKEATKNFNLAGIKSAEGETIQIKTWCKHKGWYFSQDEDLGATKFTTLEGAKTECLNRDGVFAEGE